MNSVLVDIRDLDDSVCVDVRYASSRNFMGRAMYAQARALFRPHVARALVAAHRTLARANVGLVIYDGYRPWSVSKAMWDAARRDERRFLADPEHGSVHNRGCAVDCALFNLATGRTLRMPSAFDVPTTRTNRNAQLLRAVMEAHGFTAEPTEWWHFDHKSWRRYAVLDAPV